MLADGRAMNCYAVTSNCYGPGASGPVRAPCLTPHPVPGSRILPAGNWTSASSFDSFADAPGVATWASDKSREFEPSPESSRIAPSCRSAQRVLDTHVLFGTPAFPSVEAAKAWMATKQYGELKKLLLSV